MSSCLSELNYFCLSPLDFLRCNYNFRNIFLNYSLNPLFLQFSQGLTGRPELYQKSNRSSHSSDTSSAYSGSDTMTSVQSSLDQDPDEVDLSGLQESVVDSDEEEDLAESMDVSVVLNLNNQIL